MPKTYLDAVRRKDQQVNSLFTFLDARLERAENGEAVIRMPVTGKVAQGGGMVAGGIMATLADEAMAHAVLSALPEGHFAVTAEMNIRYLRGADPQKGGELAAEARVIRQGGSLCVAEAVVRDTADRLLSTAGATFSILKAR